jgi:uridine kinase
MTPSANPSEALAENPLLSELPAAEVADLPRWLEVIDVAAGETVVREGEVGREMYFVLEGSARAWRAELELQRLGRGDHFGELALLSERRRAASVVADTPLALAKLSREAWERMAIERPTLALALLRRVVDRLGAQLVHMTENVGVLLRERSLPRRTSIEATALGERRVVAMGTPAGALLEPLSGRDRGALIVAALVDRKPVSLATPLLADAVVEPLTTRDWEGREVYRRSAGLMLLEAAHRVSPDLAVRLGPSLSSAQLVEVEGATDLESLARELNAAMDAIAARDLPIVEEIWTLEEAISHFRARGWSDAVSLLATWRDATVPLVSCGNVYALSLAPLMPRTGALDDLRVRTYEGTLLLEFGASIAGYLPEGAREVSDPALAERPRASSGAPRSPEMVVEHRRWLSTLGVESVGSFNSRCITGEVSELIRASEGFHEKRIGRIADAIRDRGRALRIISIAGPSSSGKTTFIKRLTVQLQIDGLTPRAISLDDYYVDRERTPRDARGELDFEALHALDLPLLQSHLRRLLAGEAVKTARYDFARGTSRPDGGPELRLGPHDVLMIEGIHGLNPELLAGAADREQIFRVFIHPVLSLSMDRLTAVSPADVRLLRRIVRDRHTRNLSAAENIARWPSVRDGERLHIFPFLPEADSVFDSSLAYEPSVIKVYADRYLLEVPRDHPSYPTAYRLRRLIDRFVTIYPDHVPPTSLLREFIGGSGFEY